MYNPYSLEGKTILITGASSGIGKTTAIECSKLGANVIITGRSVERLNDTFSKLEGQSNLQIVADLIEEEDIATLVNQIPDLDGLFLCAGITDTTPVKFINKEKILNVFNINYIAPILLVKLLLSKKKIKKAASLVFMSSLGVEELTPGLGIYGSSKSALNVIMRAFANELSPRKIRANSIMPMMVKTELVTNITMISSEELAKDEEKYPFGYGTPEDIAYAVIYFLSDASKWVTGSILKMDGGSTL
jgi:NAD(P)-dependent dehydrogenase (short-subunit alcohol dehydrogenase family)